MSSQGESRLSGGCGDLPGGAYLLSIFDGQRALISTTAIFLE
jgi:hypothetical protein